MSDHFLNKVYSSLLVNKTLKNKSQFRTLSESYEQIYEQESTQPTEQPNPTNQQQVQQNNNKEEQQPQKEIQIQITKPILQTVNWVGDQQKLYDAYANRDEDSKTGVGPGEYAIASVISGLTDTKELNTFISGQSESFDVSWPSKDKADYKFEVKKEEGSSVRVGKLGHAMGGYIQGVVLRVTNALQEEYNRLNDELKLNVDDTIRSNMSRVQGTKKIRGSEEPGYYSKEKPRKDYMDSRIDNWTLQGYLNALTDNMVELPKNMLFGDSENKAYKLYNTDYRYPDSSKPGSAERSQYLIISLKKLLQIVEKIATSGDSNNLSQKAQDLATTFKQFYNASGSDKGETFKRYLDQEAERVDRRLSRELCKTTGEGCKEIPDFFTTIKQEGLYQSILDAEEYINNPTNVRSLFPNAITGLFVVSSKGWKYVPANSIGEYVRVTQISQGKPKITLVGTVDPNEL